MTDLTAIEAGENFLEHYGVLGMKWGRTKADGNSAVPKGRNKDYSGNQRKRDRQIYGAGGTRRVNKKMNKGDSISVARGDEKTRRDRVMSKNKYARQGGKVAGAVGGVVLANVAMSGVRKLATSKKGMQFLAKAMGIKSREGAKVLYDGLQVSKKVLSDPVIVLGASAAAAKVGEMLSGDIGVAANMRSHGYNPDRK